MASFDMTGLDELMQAMQRKGEMAGTIATEMVTAAGEEIASTMQAEAGQFTKSGRATGAMAAAIGAHDGVMQGSGTLYTDIYPKGTDSKGVRNATKAFILHYGKKGYPATYWVDTALRKAEGPVRTRLLAMWEAFIKS